MTDAADTQPLWGEPPLCACGCEQPVPRMKDDRGWRKYASDRCMNRAKDRKRAKGRQNPNRRAVEPVLDNPVAVDLLRQVARMLGVDAQRLLVSVEREFTYGGGEIKVPEVITNERLVEVLERVAFKILASVNEPDIHGAKLRDKLSSAKAAIEVRQLLKGEPTQIRSYAEHKQMRDVLAALLREAEVRGMTIEGNFEVVGSAA